MHGPGAKAARVTLVLAPNENRSEVALSDSSAIDETDVTLKSRAIRR